MLLLVPLPAVAPCREETMFHGRLHTRSLLAVVVAAVTACEEPAAPSADEPVFAAGDGVGLPLPLSTAEERRLFRQGQIVFQTVFTPATGLGPLFNGNSCAECHEDPVAGGVGDEVEVHATAYQGGVCNDLSAEGGPVIQDSVTPALHAALGIARAPMPPDTTATARRTTPALFGFGLLDAVPDEAILALADPDDRNGDGISGRPNRSADGRLGRFGRKAFVPTLREFTASAFRNEMGVTNPAEPGEETVGGNPMPPGVDPTTDPEITQDALDATEAFMRLLAPPRTQLLSLAQVRGRQLFSSIGCVACHVPALQTGSNPVKALSKKVVPAYTDLLLHDMGSDLADICLGLAEPSEFRTEPLMGVRFKSVYLHDGRAPTIEAAIELHGGEATAARDRFAQLSSQQRAALARFLKGL